MNFEYEDMHPTPILLPSLKRIYQRIYSGSILLLGPYVKAFKPIFVGINESAELK